MITQLFATLREDGIPVPVRSGAVAANIMCIMMREKWHAISCGMTQDRRTKYNMF